MKRIIILLLIVCCTAPHLRAQFRYGLEMGVNFNRISFDKAVIDSRERQGFFFGPKIKATIPGFGLGFDAALIYSQKYYSIIDDLSDEKRQTFETDKMSFIQTPVNVRWDMGFHGWGIYLAIGPQWTWYIGQGSWNDSETFAANFKHSALGLNLGGGLWLFDHMNLGFSYTIPMSKNGNYSSEIYNKIKESYNHLMDINPIEMKYYSWQVHIDFYF